MFHGHVVNYKDAIYYENSFYFRCNEMGCLSIYVSDINECLNATLCGDTCDNTVGSYQCQCGAGYELTSDQHTCRSKSEICIFRSYPSGIS